MQNFIYEYENFRDCLIPLINLFYCITEILKLWYDCISLQDISNENLTLFQNSGKNIYFSKGDVLL